MMPEARVAPRLPTEEAVRLARQLYGLEAAAERLPGEYDDNFRLSAGDGREYVLKVMHPARERSLVALQCEALAHLALRAPALTLPRVQLASNGAAFAAAELATDATRRLVWMLSFVPGTLLAEAKPHGPDLLRSLGRLVGQIDAALVDFSHPASHRDLKWDLSRVAWVREHVHLVGGAERRALVERFLALYEARVTPVLPRLRRSVIYGDANDYNVLVGAPHTQPREVVSVIDFGDMHHGLTVAEIAIAIAYAIFGQRDPLAAAVQVLAGYHQAWPLQDAELEVLYALVGARLAVSVTNCARRKALHPDDPYVTVSEGPAWEALARLAEVQPRFAHYAFRDACGQSAAPQSESIARWLSTQSPAAVLDVDLRHAPCVVFDLGIGSRLLGADPEAAECATLTATLFTEMARAGATVGVGRYAEPRAIYTSPLFGGGESPLAERRTLHLGIDLFAASGSPVRAPLDGFVHILANNRAPLDYGPLVILRHPVDTELEFFTLYGHLSEDTLAALTVGQRIRQGHTFGRIGEPPTNGGWPPHVHFQIILDLLELAADFPGVAFASQKSVWMSLSPDPNGVLGIPAERFPPRDTTRAETLAVRRSRVGPNLSLSYREPLKIVRGFMQYLYDETGRPYLDFYNNVPLVGHSHPRVVQAAQRQLGLLNTNTRYLHDTIGRYAECLTRSLPEPLQVCFFLNSGSEANDLALRLARVRTGCEDVIVLEHAYHGHTTTLVDVSPYKFDGPGGGGRRAWVHVAPLPDDYRGRYRRGDTQVGAKYAQHVAEIVNGMRRQGRGPAAFLAETLPSVAGQIVLPAGYLASVYDLVRGAGGVCIADEVQTGFARLGSHRWGFETQGVVPDILVLGKPIGNGFPLAAVVTTPQIASAFDNGMEFFSTFGGNPVACAAGLAVLEVVAVDGLQARALHVGGHLEAGLRRLMRRHEAIGDVRGKGLFLGIELVRSRRTLEPARAEASYVVNRLRERGILTGTDGPFENVIKLRPPLIIVERDADRFLDALDSVLDEDGAQPG